MKKQVEKNMATRLVNPGMLVLVTASHRAHLTITPCAWHMPLSKEPPTLGIALSKGHFSSELIKESQEFIINVPTWNLLDKVITCGKISGRDFDKFKEAGLGSQKPTVLQNTPKIAECIGHLECMLKSINEVGDHFLFVAEVVNVEVEGDFFKGGFWDTTKTDLLFHLGGKFFFKSSAYSEAK